MRWERPVGTKLPSNSRSAAGQSMTGKMPVLPNTKLIQKPKRPVIFE